MVIEMKKDIDFWAEMEEDRQLDYLAEEVENAILDLVQEKFNNLPTHYEIHMWSVIRDLAQTKIDEMILGKRGNTK